MRVDALERYDDRRRRSRPFGARSLLCLYREPRLVASQEDRPGRGWPGPLDSAAPGTRLRAQIAGQAAGPPPNRQSL